MLSNSWLCLEHWRLLKRLKKEKEADPVVTRAINKSGEGKKQTKKRQIFRASFCGRRLQCKHATVGHTTLHAPQAYSFLRIRLCLRHSPCAYPYNNNKMAVASVKALHVFVESPKRYTNSQNARK